MRRRAARFSSAAIVAAVAVAGCGSSSGSGARWTVARATSFADSVILKATDVPGFTGSPHRESAAARQVVTQLAHCAGAVDPGRRIVDIHSDDFRRGSGVQIQQVGSSVDVLPSASLAQQDFARFAASSARHCVAQYATNALATSSLRFGTPSVQALTPPAGTSASGFGYRFVIPVTVGASRFTFYVDLLFHRAGPAEVSFTDLGIGTPFPASDQQRLFSLMVSRAAAHLH